MSTSNTCQPGIPAPFQTPLLEELLLRCKSQLPSCYAQEARDIAAQLALGVPYPLLGGCKIRRTEGILRFKLGREFRLIFKQTDIGWTPYKLVTRQAFERELVRRR